MSGIVPGVTVGRVVHFTPSHLDFQIMGQGPVGGRISAVHHNTEADGCSVSLHLDAIGPKADLQVTPIRRNVKYSETPTPDTWRFPPRV